MTKASKRFYRYFFIASLIIAGGVSYYASSNPDGLENARLSVGLSGLIGVLVTGAVAYLVFSVSKRMRKSK